MLYLTVSGFLLLTVCVFLYGCKSAGVQNELEKLRALLYAERSHNQRMTEIISSLKQDKELLQNELTKKAELICDFLQDKLRPGRVRFENPPVDEFSDCTSTACCTLTLLLLLQ